MNPSTLLNIVIVALFAWFLYSRLRPVGGLRNLGAEAFGDAMTRGDKPSVIDVREPGEYKGGYIAGAKNIPLSQLAGRLAEIPPDRPVLLYCRSGMRSKGAAKLLLKNGYRDVSHLRGGIGAWTGKVARP